MYYIAIHQNEDVSPDEIMNVQQSDVVGQQTQDILPSMQTQVDNDRQVESVSNGIHRRNLVSCFLL